MSRQPMMVNEFMNYELVKLHDDEHEKMMFDYLASVRVVDAVVLYIDIIRGHRAIDNVMGVLASNN